MISSARFLAALIVAMLTVPIAMILFYANQTAPASAGITSFKAADWAILRFSIVQAFLSAAFCVAFATLLARAITRQRFRAKNTLITLMGAPFILPVISAVLGLIAIFGRNGIINRLSDYFGLPSISIYGLDGVVLAHVFLNLPLATRMILNGWANIPIEQLRLANSLGFGPQNTFTHLEWPMLRNYAPAAFAVIFTLCFSSFAVVLTLGGGPKASTLELAIWQAIRFDFNLERAAMLSCVQLIVCIIAVTITQMLTPKNYYGFAMGHLAFEQTSLFLSVGRFRKLVDYAVLSGAVLFLFLPITAIIYRGVKGVFTLSPAIYSASLNSLSVALSATLLTTICALLFALAAAKKPSLSHKITTVTMLPLALSSLTFGTGVFLILIQFTSPAAWALWVTVFANVLLALPFIYRPLLSSAQATQINYGRLCDSLGMGQWARFRHIFLPRLSRPLGFGTGLVAALSMGDLGVIALFANQERITLPLLVQQFMGSYKMDEAMAAALLLTFLSFALFLAFDFLGRYYASS